MGMILRFRLLALSLSLSLDHDSFQGSNSIFASSLSLSLFLSVTKADQASRPSTINPLWSGLSTSLTPSLGRCALSLPHSLANLNLLSFSHSLAGLPLTAPAAPPKIQISSIFAQIIFNSRYLFSSTNRSD